MTRRKQKETRAGPQPFQLDGERKIYQYFNGNEIIAADPIRVHLDLISTEGLDVVEACKLIESGDDEASVEALKELVPAIRKAFSVEEYRCNGKEQWGMTGLECLALLYHFFDYLAYLGKGMPRSATSARPTERGCSGAVSPAKKSAPSTSSEAVQPTGVA